MFSKSQLIRTIYLYAVSLITLVMIIISAVTLINLTLKTWVFTKADRPEYYEIYSETANPKTNLAYTEEDKARLRQEQEDRYQVQKQSEAVRSFSMILVALPLFLFHWRLTKKEKEN